MNYKRKINVIIPGTVLAFFLLITSCTSNWPQFRGSMNNMVVSNNALPDEWGTEKNIRWTCDLNGTGWSSPVVWGNKVFISSAFPVKKSSKSMEAQHEESDDDTPPEPPQGTPPQLNPPPHREEQGEDTSYLQDIYRWEVTCLDLKTGKELWKQVARTGNPRIGIHPGNTNASETPVTDGKRVYVYFGMTGLYCFDLNGKPVWQKDLGAFKTQNAWGTGSSPVLYQDMLFIQVDNEVSSFLIALNAQTGEEKWRAAREEKTNYSTPIIWKNSIRTELIASGMTARSYDPGTGKVLWQLKLGGDMSIASPVADKDLLYIGNAGDEEGKADFFAVRAGAEGDITPAKGERTSKGVAWTAPDAGIGNASPLFHNGMLYFLGERGGALTCLDAGTGVNIYREKVDSVAACWATPWVNNDKLFFTDDKGTTHVIRAGKKFESLSKNRLKDKFWSSVAISKDAYILKGAKRMYCIGY